MRAELNWLYKACCVVLLCAPLCFANNVYAAAATVANMSGVLFAKKMDGTVKALYEKSEVDEGDVLSTEKDSYARLKFTDGGEITLRPNSSLKIDSYSYEEADAAKDGFVFSLIKGGFRAVTGLVGKRGNKSVYRASTPVATIGIRGTDWGALFCQNDCGDYHGPNGQTPGNGLYVNVNSGGIVTVNNGGSLEFSPGQFGYVSDLNTPPLLIPKDPGLPTFGDKPATDKGADNNPAKPGCVVN